MNTYVLAVSLLVLFASLAVASIKVEMYCHRASPHWLWVILPPLLLAIACLVGAFWKHWLLVPWFLITAYIIVLGFSLLLMGQHWQKVMSSSFTPLTGVSVGLVFFLVMNLLAEFFYVLTDTQPEPLVVIAMLLICITISWNINRRLEPHFKKREMSPAC